MPTLVPKDLIFYKILMKLPNSILFKAKTPDLLKEETKIADYIPKPHSNMYKY